MKKIYSKKNKSNSSYSFVWGNHQSLLTLEANLDAVAFHRQNEWNRIKNIILFSQDNTIKCFHSVNDLKNDKRHGRVFLNRDYCQNFLDQVDQNYKNSWKLFRKLKKSNYKKLSNVALFGLLCEAKNNWIEQMSFFRALQTEGTSALAEELEKFFPKEEMQVIIHRIEPDIADLERKEWRRIAKKNRVTDEMLLKHADRFPWIAAVHFQVKDVLNTLKSRLKTENLDYSGPNKKEKILLENKQKRILSKVPAKIKEYAATFHELSIARMKIKSCWGGLDYYMIALIQEIANRAGEHVVDINKYYITEDIRNLLLSKKKVSTAEKKRRQFCFSGRWKDNKLIFKSGRPAFALAKAELGELMEKKNTREIKGVGVNPGRIRNVVRILMSNKIENAKKLRREFKKGQILITQMTQPNIFDIASRAGAIVTDEGGMLSHAAIISREFGIPCVVGTHEATTVLKDGDLVEVDADKGVVRIIKSN